MKKLFVAILTFAMSAGLVSAQDLAQVTESFNKAAEALNAGDKATALTMFTELLPQAAALGADGEAIATQCKNQIPGLYVSAAKASARAGENDAALASLDKAVKTGEEYGESDAVEEAKTLISQISFSVSLNKAEALTQAGDFDGAIAALNSVMSTAPEGMIDGIKKKLSRNYLFKANAKFKAKDMKAALESAQKSIENGDNANAQKIAGHAALSLKQYKVAADAYEAYLAMSPNAKDKVQVMYQTGSAYQSLGDAGKACGYFKQIAQDPKWGEGARYQMTVLKCN